MTHPYPPPVRKDLLRMVEGGGSRGEDEREDVRDLCIYNALLGRIFADAAKAVVSKVGVNMSDVLLIGSHG